MEGAHRRPPRRVFESWRCLADASGPLLLRLRSRCGGGRPPAGVGSGGRCGSWPSPLVALAGSRSRGSLPPWTRSCSGGEARGGGALPGRAGNAHPGREDQLRPAAARDPAASVARAPRRAVRDPRGPDPARRKAVPGAPGARDRAWAGRPALAAPGRSPLGSRGTPRRSRGNGGGAGVRPPRRSRAHDRSIAFSAAWAAACPREWARGASSTACAIT